MSNFVLIGYYLLYDWVFPFILAMRTFQGLWIGPNTSGHYPSPTSLTDLGRYSGPTSLAYFTPRWKGHPPTKIKGKKKKLKSQTFFYKMLIR